MEAAQETHAPGRALRADAMRNRQRVAEAARAVFAEQGLDVPLEEIADRAGVGIATLYRRFPTREELVMAAFEAKLAEYVAVAEEALQAADPWAGFSGYVERICAMQAADRGFTDVVTMALSTSEQAERLREQAHQAVTELIRRAQEVGRLRADFVPEDLLLVLMANAGVVHATRDAAPHAWRRLVAYLLEAFAADRTGPLPAAPTAAQARRAMIGNATAKGICAGRTRD
ncbi:AcrR family transcriptional regulator [Streptacidiphilus sp. MAP12-16]|uniref:TetR/AcrR family transcriptional regulator n=1 Tax=Streptacidiphilus sp. MAP12-16 TaxID=3156300 RepID=UPI00351618D3